MNCDEKHEKYMKRMNEKRKAYATIDRWVNHAEACARNEDEKGELIALEYLEKLVEKGKKRCSSK